MTATAIGDGSVPGDPNRIGHGDVGAGTEATGAGEGGPASKRIIVGYGFWIYLLSDIIMFAAFFAAYAVLSRATAGGPGPRDLFELGNVAIQTALLLASSFACGMAAVAAEARSRPLTQAALVLTGLLGLAFLVLEVQEFASLMAEGAGPTRSAFLSSFFALVGLHGLHIGAGLLWLGTMMAQIHFKGFRDDIARRLMCFTLFWHALDIVWIALVTNVYLMGFT